MAINTLFENIADAIREKAGTSGLLTPAQMPQAILDIQGGLPLLQQSEWEALTTQEKKAYGLVAIQQASTGYKRGILVNGADYFALSLKANYGTGLSGSHLYNYTIPEDGYYLVLAIIGSGTQPSQTVHTIQPRDTIGELLDGGNSRYVRYEVSYCYEGDVLTISAPTTDRANGGCVVVSLDSNYEYSKISAAITRDGTRSYTLPVNNKSYVVIGCCTGRTIDYAKDQSTASDYVVSINQAINYQYTWFRCDFTEGNGGGYAFYGYDGGCAAIIVLECVGG